MSDVTRLDQTLLRAAEVAGTPSFVYLCDDIRARAEQIQRAFGARFAISFAVKANPNPGLLSWLRGKVPYLDVSSIGELRLAMGTGWDASCISFTGPGKRRFELEEAIRSGVGELVVESVAEARDADALAAQAGRVQDILIRLAPDRVPKGFGDQMAGKPVAFGVDQESFETDLPAILSLKHLRCIGLHIYSGTQCLNPEAVCENYRNFISIFESVCSAYALEPQKLIFGSGLGIPYHPGDQALDLTRVAQGICADLDAMKRKPELGSTKLVLELGRYLVGEAGYFLTRVIRVKESRGSRIAICDGGLNNHLPATGHFGMVIHRNYLMHKVAGAGEASKVDLVGPLCTSIDRLARNVMLPHVAEGDLIAVHNSGAYGLTASPMYFISHPLPREVLVEGDDLRDVTRNFVAV